MELWNLCVRAYHLRQQTNHSSQDCGRVEAHLVPRRSSWLRLKATRLVASSVGSLSNLASLSRTHGKYNKAKELYVRATAVREDSRLGESDNCRTISLVCCRSKARTTRPSTSEPSQSARRLWVQNAQISLDGSTGSPFLEARGRYETCQAARQTMAMIGDNALGAEHAVFAAQLNNLGSVLMDQDSHIRRGQALVPTTRTSPHGSTFSLFCSRLRTVRLD